MALPVHAAGNAGYYEVRDANSKGRGAFALKAVPAGTRILVDHALFAVPSTEEKIVLDKVAGLDPATRQLFNSLPRDPKFSNPDMARFSMSNFQINSTGMVGAFAHASRLNHSCQPNCAMTTTADGQMQCHVINNISKGEELTFAYCQDVLFASSADRNSWAFGEFRGPCQCSICTSTPAALEVSDLRRQMMRRLLFSFRQKDLDNLEPTITTTDYIRNDWDLPSDPACLFTQLAAAEGVQSSIVYFAYRLAVGQLFNHMMGKNLMRVPPKTLSTLQQWVSTARGMKRRIQGADSDVQTYNEAQFDHTCSLVDDLGPWGLL